MSISTKILAVIGTIVFLGMLGVLLYEFHAVNERQKAIENEITQQKALADNITRSMGEWATKSDLNQFAKDSNLNLAAIQKDLSTLNASVSAINSTTSISSGQVYTNLPSNGSVKNPNVTLPTATCDGKQIPCPNADPYGYMAATQQFNLNEKFGNTEVPIGTVGFNASSDKPWSENLPPRKYNAITVIGQDENQRMYAYNKFTISQNGKDYEIPVNSGQIKQEYPDPKFTLFNPSLYLGIDGGINLANAKGEAGPSISLQLSSYGRYINQPDLSIAQIGAGYDMFEKRVQFQITPVSYNIGKNLPLMNNLYIGPNVGINTAGAFNVGVGLHVGL